MIINTCASIGIDDTTSHISVSSTNGIATSLLNIEQMGRKQCWILGCKDE